jgi:tripartite-type tricarboxylate transporter receptor subunit TctC
LAQREPGKLAIGTSVVGSGGCMATELFKQVARVDMPIVPYKGTGTLANDALGEHVPVSFNTVAPIFSNIAGAICALSALRTSRSITDRFPHCAERKCRRDRMVCASGSESCQFSYVNFIIVS